MYKKVEGGEEMAYLLFVFCFTMAFCQTTVSKMSKITVRRISAEEMPCLHHLVRNLMKSLLNTVAVTTVPKIAPVV